MKKSLIIIVSMLCLTSCWKSEEEQLKEWIAEVTKAHLYIPDSYDPVSLSCDSLFTDFINDKNIKDAVKIVDLMKEAASLQRTIDCNLQEKELWDRSYFSERYNQCERKIQTSQEQRAEKIRKAHDLFNRLVKEYHVEKEFNGFIVYHSYRAQTNGGQTVFGHTIYLLNKDKDEITAVYDAEDEDVLTFSQLSQTIKELGENCKSEYVDLEEICSNIKSKYELMR